MFNKYDYRKINYEVMSDTKHQYETLPELKDAVCYSIDKQLHPSERISLEKKDGIYLTVKWKQPCLRSYLT